MKYRLDRLKSAHKGFIRSKSSLFLRSWRYLVLLAICTTIHATPTMAGCPSEKAREDVGTSTWIGPPQNLRIIKDAEEALNYISLTQAMRANRTIKNLRLSNHHPSRPIAVVLRVAWPDREKRPKGQNIQRVVSIEILPHRTIVLHAKGRHGENLSGMVGEILEAHWSP